MDISSLGEVALIERLTKDLPIENGSTVRAAGDDCAVLQYNADRETLLTTHLMLEGIHFDLQYFPLIHLGYKAAVAAISNIYAMNGAPRQLTVALGLSRRFTVEHVEELYAGVRLACTRHHVDLVGGDTSASLTGLTIAVTAVGDVPRGEAVYRSGAKENDIVCVSGNLGAAYMGLQLLEREKNVYNQQVKEAGAKADQIDFQPDFTGREYLLERQLKPEARRDIIEALAREGLRPTSMVDVSDGLASELMHLCKDSGVGCRVYEDRLPLDYQTAAQAEELNMNVTTCALNGGDDYELLFTLPLADKDRVEKLDDVKMIGYITAADTEPLLITRDGSEFRLKAQGWTSDTTHTGE